MIGNIVYQADEYALQICITDIRATGTEIDV